MSPVPWAWPSKVYFIADGEAVKIGVSTLVKARLQDLQVAHYRRLQLIGTIPGNADVESRLHKQFKHLRLSGEWFRAEPELLSFIKQEITVRDQIEQVRRELLAWGDQQVSLEVKSSCRSVADDLKALIEKPEDSALKARAMRAIKEMDRLRRKPPPPVSTEPRLNAAALAAIAAARA